LITDEKINHFENFDEFLSLKLSNSSKLFLFFKRRNMDLFMLNLGVYLIPFIYRKRKVGTLLHASGICKNKKGLIFLGLRNVGKSSLAYKLFCNGFSYVDDDYIFVFKDKNKLKMAGFKNIIKLREDFVLKNKIKPDFVLKNKIKPDFVNYFFRLKNTERKKIDVTNIFLLYKNKNKKNRGIEKIKNYVSDSDFKNYMKGYYENNKFLKNQIKKYALFNNINLFKVNVHHKSNYELIINTINEIF